MQDFSEKELKKLYISSVNSHKGQNGKLLLISGSKLFHSSSLWGLKVASRIVDMVFYSSVDENNKIVQDLKKEFRDGIVVPRSKIEDYIKETDCILIGSGLPRKDGEEKGDDDTKELTENLLKKYPKKKWVIDGGSLQVINPEIIPQNSIITPHSREFKILFGINVSEENIKKMSKKYRIVILAKGQTDFICQSFGSAQSKARCVRVSGGNVGMTKGGTGDILAALIASFYCKNNAFLSACAGSYINKKAGENLFKRVGYYFNSSDLVDEIPRIMRDLLI